MNRRSLLVVGAGLLAPAAFAQSGERRVEVPLPAVGEQRTFAETILEYEVLVYAVTLQQGQSLRVTLVSNNAANCFDLHAPGATKPVFVGADSGNDHTLVARSAGEHLVRVHLLRFAARDGQSASFTLKLLRVA